MANFDWIKALQQANGGPLPLVNDNLPWQAMQQGVGELAGTARDLSGGTDHAWAVPGQWAALTGQPGGESAQGPWSDYTPVLGGQGGRLLGPENTPGIKYQPGGGQGGNAFGYSYSDPGGGWNPWSLYDGREGFDGTAADGFYNAVADKPRPWGPNGKPETDRDRVWRLTLDALGPNPGGQPPERVKAEFLNQVARLHRDMDATYGPQAWAGSAFSGYDKFAQGGQGGAPATSGAAKGRGDQPPGSVVINGGGGTPGAPGTPGTPTPGTPGAPGTSTPGTGDTGDYATLMSTDKAFRTAQLLKALGLDTIDKRMSYGGSVQADQAPGLYEAWRQTQGLDPGGGTPAATDWGAQIANFAKTYHGQGAMPAFQQAGQQALQTIMDPAFQQGMTDQELMNLIQGFESLVNAPINDVQKRFRNNLTDQSVGQFLQQPGVETGSQRFIPYLQGNPLYNFLTGQR